MKRLIVLLGYPHYENRYITIFILSYMRRVKVMNGNLDLRDRIDVIIEKRVTKFGSGAKIDCPKEYLGKRAYILICKDEE